MISPKKILNDPVYGFITIPYPIVLDIIDHPYFQRLRRIKQLGLSHLVFPGGLHNRFHHALGAMHLMTEAIDIIRSKGHEITDEEAKGVTLAILLHDIGHGPFSHALEHSIVAGVTHEDISAIFMNRLNDEFNGELDLAIEIFNDRYEKRFLHQLVSSQLDMDRLDYLKRDSFYTGVFEGVISSDRIIKMLNVKDDALCVEKKGIYSIEKFIVARRLMYWQVYLHKAVVAAEFMLVNILKRAKHLAENGEELFCTPALRMFLYESCGMKEFEAREDVLNAFAELDDYDMMAAMKVWASHEDKVLSKLCKGIVDRSLFGVEVHDEPVADSRIDEVRRSIMEHLGLDEDEAGHFIVYEEIVNNAYDSKIDRINILQPDGTVTDYVDASDGESGATYSGPVTKYFLCYPKEIRP